MMGNQPQWQQDADRHSRLVDPVVTIQELSRFKPLRTTRIDYALVFTTAQGGLDPYLPPNRPSRTELATRRWTSVYEVDMGLHDADAVLALPSGNDAFLFEVSLSCSWQVLHPALFVASGERNVPAMIQRLVDNAVRPVLRRYAMTDSAAAEHEAQWALAAAEPLGAAAGLHIGCVLQIRRDEAALAHEHELREIQFAREKLEPRHALLMREDELAAERALVQGQQQHQVELQNQNLVHERQLIRGRQEVELQEIEAQKIQYYAYYLEQGGPTAMAFQLAKHPEDTRLVMENLREDQMRTMQSQMQLVLQALGGGPGGLEEHQLDEPRRMAVNLAKQFLSAKRPSALPGDPPGGVPGGVPGDLPAVEAVAPDAAPEDSARPADGDAMAPPPAPPGHPGGGAAPKDAGPVFGYRPSTPPPGQ
ncbi:PE-PGRS family protein [Streptomyces sp. UNOB3_S3]|uniref:PE-PGRS family protein n=1 Tax=Streptomyces sp. UNOB3_S3 TaxID=2871682 RepID=UPI001E5D50A1|nr:PE-PGRS family protein [Streptomyces sp. UNOB3_S3]MCC3774289.1 PE-PGRS family protein [Streptomyces sp. UNOB3_S3]